MSTEDGKHCDMHALSNNTRCHAMAKITARCAQYECPENCV